MAKEQKMKQEKRVFPMGRGGVGGFILLGGALAAAALAGALTKQGSKRRNSNKSIDDTQNGLLEEENCKKKQQDQGLLSLLQTKEQLDQRSEEDSVEEGETATARICFTQIGSCESMVSESLSMGKESGSIIKREEQVTTSGNHDTVSDVLESGSSSIANDFDMKEDELSKEIEESQVSGVDFDEHKQKDTGRRIQFNPFEIVEDMNKSSVGAPPIEAVPLFGENVEIVEEFEKFEEEKALPEENPCKQEEEEKEEEKALPEENPCKQEEEEEEEEDEREEGEEGLFEEKEGDTDQLTESSLEVKSEEAGLGGNGDSSDESGVIEVKEIFGGSIEDSIDSNVEEEKEADSDGTGDSSVASKAEAIWPVELIEGSEVQIGEKKMEGEITERTNEEADREPKEEEAAAADRALKEEEEVEEEEDGLRGVMKLKVGEEMCSLDQNVAREKVIMDRDLYLVKMEVEIPDRTTEEADRDPKEEEEEEEENLKGMMKLIEEEKVGSLENVARKKVTMDRDMYLVKMEVEKAERTTEEADRDPKEEEEVEAVEEDLKGMMKLKEEEEGSLENVPREKVMRNRDMNLVGMLMQRKNSRHFLVSTLLGLLIFLLSHLLAKSYY